MFDTLPFPNTTAKDADERSRQTIDYLLQLREELVFILESIVAGEYGRLSTQNVQPSVVEAVITRSESSLTVAEVVNSAVFKNIINNVKKESKDRDDNLAEADNAIRQAMTEADNAITQSVNAITQSVNALSQAINNVDKALGNLATELRQADSTLQKNINTVEGKIPTQYVKSAEQTQISNEPNGINIYSVTDASGTIHELKVRNGKTPTITMSVNFTTGNLEYTST